MLECLIWCCIAFLMRNKNATNHWAVCTIHSGPLSSRVQPLSPVLNWIIDGAVKMTRSLIPPPSAGPHVLCWGDGILALSCIFYPILVQISFVSPVSRGYQCVTLLLTPELTIYDYLQKKSYLSVLQLQCYFKTILMGFTSLLYFMLWCFMNL